MKDKKTILKWLFTTLWVLVGASVVVLLVAAIRKEEKVLCKGVNITIKGVNNNFFVDKNDILQAINDYIEGSPKGQPVVSFKLKAMENDLQRNIWVKKAQLFFDNNAVLQVNVLEREPVARVFTPEGTTFYVDSSYKMLPLSDKFSARLPVFTGFPSDKPVLSKADSALLIALTKISLAVQKDSFCMALIDQIDITAQRNFELIPKIGNTVITLGSAADVENKFKKLRLFYQNVMVKAGWDYYSVVGLQYSNQIVAKRKGAEDASSDSLRTLELMKLIAYNAELQASDSLQTIVQDNEHNSTNANLIQQSFQRDDEAENPAAVAAIGLSMLDNKKPVVKIAEPTKPVLKLPLTVNTIHPLKKPVIKKPVGIWKKPVVTKPTPNNVKPLTKQPAAVTAKPVVKQMKPLTKKPLVKPNNEY